MIETHRLGSGLDINFAPISLPLRYHQKNLAFQFLFFFFLIWKLFCLYGIQVDGQLSENGFFNFVTSYKSKATLTFIF